MATPGHGTQLSHVDTCFTVHCYCMYLRTYATDLVLHRYFYYNHISLLHRLTYMYAMIVFVFLLLHVIWIIVTWVFLYSCNPITTVSQYWYWYILLLDMLAIDTRGVVVTISYISHLLFPFSVILFNDINIAHVQLSCYMYHALLLYSWYTV